MKVRLVAVSLVAFGLGLLLGWRGAATPGLYRLGFFFGLAASLALLLPGGEMIIGISPGPWRSALLPIGLTVMMAPFIVLVEAGIAGYLGFESFMRYVSLIL